MFDPNSAPGVLLQATGAIAGLTGTWLVNRRNPSGYRFWLISNLALMAFQVLLGAWMLAALNVAYLVLIVQGLKLNAASGDRPDLDKRPSALTGSQTSAG